MSVTHAEAVQRLRKAGVPVTAARINLWRNKDGKLWGWDGHVRGYFSHKIVEIIWPDESLNEN